MCRVLPPVCLTLLSRPHSYPSQAEVSRCKGSIQNAAEGQSSTPIAISANSLGSNTPTRSSSSANISSTVSSSVGRRETPRPPTRRASFSALTTSLLGRLPSAQEAPPYEIAAGLHSGTCSAGTPESLCTMQSTSSLGKTPSTLDMHQATCSAGAADPSSSSSTAQDHIPHPHALSPCGVPTTTASVHETARLLPLQPNSVSERLHPPGTGLLLGELSLAAPCMQAACQAQPTHTSSVSLPPVSSSDIIYVSEVVTTGATAASAVTHTVIGPMDALSRMSEILSTESEGCGGADPAFGTGKRWNSLSILPRPTTEPSGTGSTSSSGSQPAVKAHTLAMHRSLPSFPSS